MASNGGLQELTRGQYVEVFGLQSQTGRLMNRQRGTVIKTNDVTGRIEVCLGAEGKIVSLKLESLRLVVGASAEELEDAKDVAGPALRAAQEAGAQPVHDIGATTEIPQPPERERSRSWSPPPEAVRAAAAAAQQASGIAVARGLSSEEAEALGAAAAEQSLSCARDAANLQKQRGDQQSSMNIASQPSSVSASVGATTRLEHLKVGDTVKAVGLKGADKQLSGSDAVIQDFQGFGDPQNRRYVVSLIKLVIDEHGELAEQKKILTLSAKNIRLPGDDTAEVESKDSSDSKKARDRHKKKSTSKRSRSRRRSRRKRSRSDSTRSRSARPIPPAREPAPAMTKAERLRRFGFVQQQR